MTKKTIKKKRIRRKLGDVMAIKLKNGKYTFAWYTGRNHVFFDFITDKIPINIEEIVNKKVLFRIWIMVYMILDGTWPIIGNVPVPEEEASYLPHKFKRDIGSRKLEIFDHSIDNFLPTTATKKECIGLEDVSIWTDNCLEERLLQYFEDGITRHDKEIEAVLNNKLTYIYKGEENFAMPPINFPYKEGDWFMLPLEDKGFAIGLVVRADKEEKFFSYFFSPRIYKEPKKKYLDSLNPDSAIFVARYQDFKFPHYQTWKTIKNNENFQRKDWPIPEFVRFDATNNKFFLINRGENACRKFKILISCYKYSRIGVKRI